MRKFIIVVILLGILFSFYLGFLYRELDHAFNQQDQFVPTRIFSDVIKLSPPQSRKLILDTLKVLGYTIQINSDDVFFTLHPIHYPTYLIPEDHPTLAAQSKPIRLHFDGIRDNAALISIQLEEKEISELFLEPELVATFSRGSREIRTLVPFQDIPTDIWKAIIAIEDQHFLEHSGFDFRGIARAFWVNFKTLSFAQGGSTLTQQLVKNLMARKSKNLFKKINELFLAIFLEARYSKEKILERYLNEVYLGQVGNLEVHGIAEGAEHFFGKKITELNLAEIALMAGLIRGPGFYSPYRFWNRALERMRLVLRKMAETSQIAHNEEAQAYLMPIHLAPPKISVNKAPYFTDYVKAELYRHLKDKMTEEEISLAGFRVYTTLDVKMNEIAQKTVQEGVAPLERQGVEGALAAVDPGNGYIRALVGGKNYSKSNFNRILNMKRQVGSTFKPFVYLTALSLGKDSSGIPYGGGYPLQDEPWTLTYDHGKQTWSPKNYENEYLGSVSFRTALAKSINVATARLGADIGVEPIIKTAKALGIESPLPPVPSLSLGSAELTPVELLRAYAVIANHGVQDELTVIRAITHDNGNQFARFIYHPKEVFLRAPIDLLIDLLQSVFAEGGTAQNAVAFGFDRPAAGKTGTTSQYRDSWFAGFTPQLAAVVWVGLDGQDEKIHSKTRPPKLTGAGTALPIWANFMNQALESAPILSFPASPHLQNFRINRTTGKGATSNTPESQTLVEKYENEPPN